MNKNSPSKEMSLAFPLSAGALHQFLSSQSTERGLKIKKAYTTKPVLTVREKSQPLSQKQRNAWAFHLKEIHQRQAGTDEAENADAQIESFLKSDAARATAGTLLGPVAALMKAEQVCIQKASSIVRRWMANEQNVQEIATSTDDKDASPVQAIQYKNALTLARQTLAKFPDFQHGEIDVELIRDSAYSIGSMLSKNEIQDLQKARLIIAKRSQQLADYIGPEVPPLIELCMCAKGFSLEEYRAAYATKDLCSQVAAALRARTDNEEYVVPPSPRNAEKGTNLKTSVPSIMGSSSGVVQAGRTMPEQESSRGISRQTGNDSRMTGPSPRTSSGAALQTVHTDTTSSASRGTSRPLIRSVTEGTPAALVVELKSQQRQQLAHSVTVAASTSPQQAGEYSPYRPLQAREKSDTTQDEPALKKRAGHVRSASNTATQTEEPVKKSSQEKRKLHRSMQYTAPPFLDSPDTPNATDKEDRHAPASVKAKEREYKARRAAQKEQRLSQPSVQEMKALRQSSPSRKQEKASEEVHATGPARLTPQYNNALMKKWASLDGKLGPQFDPKARDAVKRLLPFCHSLDLDQLDKAALLNIVTTAELSRKDRDALIQARDVLLADSLKGTQAVAANVFPELLALLVFAIDALRALRAKS
jgi:hypothetical protein